MEAGATVKRRSDHLTSSGRRGGRSAFRAFHFTRNRPIVSLAIVVLYCTPLRQPSNDSGSIRSPRAFNALQLGIQTIWMGREEGEQLGVMVILERYSTPITLLRDLTYYCNNKTGCLSLLRKVTNIGAARIRNPPDDTQMTIRSHAPA